MVPMGHDLWDVGPGGDSVEGGLPHQEAHRKRGRSQVPPPLAMFFVVFREESSLFQAKKVDGSREPVGKVGIIWIYVDYVDFGGPSSSITSCLSGNMTKSDPCRGGTMRSSW